MNVLQNILEQTPWKLEAKMNLRITEFPVCTSEFVTAKLVSKNCTTISKISGDISVLSNADKDPKAYYIFGFSELCVS